MEAEPLCRRALAIREKAFGPEDVSVASSLNALADLLKELGRYHSIICLFKYQVSH